MLKYLQVENSFLAPTVVLAKTEGMGGRLLNSGMIHGFQVDVGRRRHDYSLQFGDYLKIIPGGKCDIYITLREALASSIEKYWV